MSTHYFRIGNIVTRIADGACIPEDEGNDDYVRFLREIAEHAADPTYLIDGYDPMVPLLAVQASAMADVDAESERIRLRYITGGDGQAQVYAAKLQQALEYQAATGTPDIKKWALLEADVDATGKNPAAAVAAIINANKAWVIAAAKIERVRLRCKKQIEAAMTPVAVLAERDNGLAQLRALTKQ